MFVGISKSYGVSVRDSACLCEFVDVSVYSGVSEYISVDSCVFAGISMYSGVSVCICAFSCDFVGVRMYEGVSVDPEIATGKEPFFGRALLQKRNSTLESHHIISTP